MRLGHFSREAAADVLAYAVAVALFLLFFGRFIGLPLFLAAIVSPSMEPTIRVGDVVVVQRGTPYGVGDVIMWCSSPFYCVVHRVIELGSTYVITKGDANPVPDLPISLSSVVGKVVAVIPREALLVTVVLIVGAQVWRKRHSLFRPSDPVSFMVYGLTTFLALSIVTLLFFPAPSVFEIGEFRVPSVTMLSATYVNGSAILRYRPVYTEIIEVLSCGVGAHGIPHTRCGGEVVGGDTVVISLPPSLLAELNERGLSKFWVSLVCSLAGNGTMKGNYTVIFKPLKLTVEVVNGSLVVRNPNPFGVPYNLTVFFTSGVRWERNVSIGYISGLGSLEVRADGWRRVWYSLHYTFMGEVVEVSGWVRSG